MTTGRKRGKRLLLFIGISLLLVVVLFPIGYWLKLPRYQGETVLYWWDQVVQGQLGRFAPGQAVTFEMVQERQERAERALNAFSKMDHRAGEFLVSKLKPGTLFSVWFKSWNKLSPSLRNRLQFLEPLDPGNQQDCVRSIFFRSPELLTAAKPQLLTLMLDPASDAQTRYTAFSLLSSSRGKFAGLEEKLAEILSSPDVRFARWAAHELSELGPAARDYAADLRAAIRAERIPASTGVHALVAIQAPVWSSLAALNEELGATNIVPMSALHCVPRLGEDKQYLVPGLKRILHHPDARFVATAIKLFNTFGDEARPLAPALVQTLQSPWYFLRAESALALERIGGNELLAAEPQLRSMILDPHPDVSNAVHRVLQSIRELRKAETPNASESSNFAR